MRAVSGVVVAYHLRSLLTHANGHYRGSGRICLLLRPHITLSIVPQRYENIRHATTISVIKFESYLQNYNIRTICWVFFDDCNTSKTCYRTAISAEKVTNTFPEIRWR